MNITIFDSFEACLPRRAAWNRLAAEISNDVGLTFEWHWALQQAHKTRVRIAWLEEGGELVGILPWYVEQREMRKVPLQIASPLTNVFANDDALLLRDCSVENIRRVLDSLEQHGLSWNVFAFPASPASAHAIDYAGTANGTRIEIQQLHNSPYLPLDGTADTFLAEQSKNFRYNIRRKTRGLEKAGKLECVTLGAAADIDYAMNCILEIERQSWKEAAGTSITARAWEEAFYRTLGKLTAEPQWLRIYILLLDGQPIGYDYALIYRDRYFMLKTSFVESFSKFSPGTVLRWRVIQDLYAEGVREHDFLGEPDPYKMAWAKETRSHQAVLIYNRGLRASFVQGLGRLKRLASRASTEPDRSEPVAP